MFMVVEEKEHYLKQLDSGKMTEKDALKLIIEYMFSLECQLEDTQEQIGNLSKHLGV